MKLTPAEKQLELAIFTRRFDGRHDLIKKSWYDFMQEKEDMAAWRPTLWQRILGAVLMGKNWEHKLWEILGGR